MNDPYIQKNGTLKNKLGITDYQELRTAEKDISFVKMLDAETAYEGNLDIQTLKAIHRHIFEDVYDWAGEFRVMPLFKQELIIPGISLNYAEPKNIEKELIKHLDEMNSANWQGKNIDELTKQFVSYLAKIWRVHPFRDGNTRTTLTFASAFAKQHGFELDLSTMLDDLGRVVDEDTKKVKRWSIRDKFVLAALDERDYPEPEALEAIIKRAIINGGKYQPKELDEIEK